jgi:hypothetical protein
VLESGLGYLIGKESRRIIHWKGISGQNNDGEMSIITRRIKEDNNE